MTGALGIDSPLRGITLKLLSIVFFMCMASLIKSTAPHIPPGEAVFFRSAFALPVIFLWLWMTGDLSRGVKVKDPWGHVARGLIGTSAMASGFAALGLLPLPEVTAIGFLAPLLTVILAAIFLGERVRLFRLSMVLFGLIGVSIILWPRLTVLTGETFDQSIALGIMLVLMAAVFRSLAQIQIRRLAQIDHTAAIVFWFSVTATLVSLVTIFFGWEMPTASEALRLVIAGLCGGVGQIAVTSSYRFAGASLLAPFEYSSILLASFVGYRFFGEALNAHLIVGSAIIVAAGIAIILRERALGLKHGVALKSMTPQG